MVSYINEYIFFKRYCEITDGSKINANVFSRMSMMVFCVIPLIKVNKKSTVNSYFAVTNY